MKKKILNDLGEHVDGDNVADFELALEAGDIFKFQIVCSCFKQKYACFVAISPVNG